MEQLSFLEKLGVLFQNMLAHPIFIFVLFSPAFLIFLSKKIKKKAILFIYIIILFIVLYVGNTTIFVLFDNLMDNIFMTLYFPNFITLFMVEIISAIICLVTLIKKDIKKANKIVNIISFAIIQTIFVLVLTIIQANEIDIYKENALYSNNDILTLMQLLTGTFALQVIILMVVWAIDKVTEKLDGPIEGEIIHRPLEGRITHATLEGAKVINKKPEIIIEMPPVKPLDKSLIESVKINPLDLNEEIIKEKNNPLNKDVLEQLIVPPKTNVEVKYVMPEVKLDPVLPQEPLNKGLIINTNISPKDIKEEIKEEKRKLDEIQVSDELSKKVKQFEKDRLIISLPDKKLQTPLDKSLFKEEKIEPIDLNDAVFNERMKVLDKTNTILEIPSVKKAKNKKFKKQVASIKKKLKPAKDIKTPTILKPIEEDKAVFTVTDKMSPLRYVESASETLNIPKKDYANKFVSGNILAKNDTLKENKPDLMKPMKKDINTKNIDNKSHISEVELNKKDEIIHDSKKELITNLEIVDYDKMVEAIKDLKIVYTM